MSEMYCYAGDLLGYKNILQNLSLDDQHKQIKAWKNLVKTTSENLTTSDTVYVKAEDEKDNLKKLLNFSCRMMTEGIKNGLLIRGAIAFGEVVFDREMNLAYGNAVSDAYTLAENQDWIGTCCEPHLPTVDCLWDFDLVFVYPAPMKGGTVLFRPVVSWKVPDYEDLRRTTTEFGLTKKGETMNWKYANRIQNTIIFSLYLKGVKAGLIKAKPKSFPGDSPMWHIYKHIDDLTFTAKMAKGGYTLTQTPDGKKTYQ